MTLFSIPDKDGFNVYSDIKYNGKPIDELHNRQILLIKVCEELARFKHYSVALNNPVGAALINSITSSIRVTEDGKHYSYHNIEIKYLPEQICNVQWRDDSHNTQKITFSRTHISNRFLEPKAKYAAYEAAYEIYRDNGVNAAAVRGVDKQMKDAYLKYFTDRVGKNKNVIDWLHAMLNKIPSNVWDDENAEAKADAAKGKAKGVDAFEADAQEEDEDAFAVGGGNKIRKRTKMKKIKRKKTKKNKKNKLVKKF